MSNKTWLRKTGLLPVKVDNDSSIVLRRQSLNDPGACQFFVGEMYHHLFYTNLYGSHKSARFPELELRVETLSFGSVGAAAGSIEEFRRY